MFVPSFAYFIYSCPISRTVFINSIKHIYICYYRWGNSISLKGVVNVLDFTFISHQHCSSNALSTVAKANAFASLATEFVQCHNSPHSTKKPVTSARAIIKVSGHQHQWFPGVSQVVTM